VAIALVILFSLFAFANNRQDNMRVKKADIYVEQTFDNYFIDEKDVLGLLTKNGDEVLEEEAFKKLNFKQLEKRVKENLFVDDVETYRDIKGTLFVKANQRKPIARIARSGATDFYIDAKGNVFPMSDKFTARVLVVDGAYSGKLLSKGFKKDKANQAYLDFIKRIESDKFLAAQIHQISIDHLGRINLYQQVGGQVIEFGVPDEKVEEKFEKLDIFYQRILPVKGWNAYKRVNLNFDRQIICE
jgi:cell division protein FtsQ